MCRTWMSSLKHPRFSTGMYAYKGFGGYAWPPRSLTRSQDERFISTLCHLQKQTTCSLSVCPKDCLSVVRCVLCVLIVVFLWMVLLCMFSLVHLSFVYKYRMMIVEKQSSLFLSPYSWIELLALLESYTNARQTQPACPHVKEMVQTSIRKM